MVNQHTVFYEGSCTSWTMSVSCAVDAMLSSNRALLSFVYCQHFTKWLKHRGSATATGEQQSSLTCALVLAAVSLYAFLGFAMDGPASLVTSLIGLQIAPHFNKPFLAESLTSFWGKRWNLTISNCLRGPVYDPIYEGTESGMCTAFNCIHVAYDSSNHSMACRHATCSRPSKVGSASCIWYCFDHLPPQLFCTAKVAGKQTPICR